VRRQSAGVQIEMTRMPYLLRKHRGFISILSGLPLALFAPLPGLLIGSLFWPQGGQGDLTVTQRLIFLGVMYGGSWLGWAGLIWACLGLQPRHKSETKSSVDANTL
jgi:hypothetical protein